jgi:hypothetical protein
MRFASLTSSSNPHYSTISFCLRNPLRVKLRDYDHHIERGLQMHQQMVLDWALWSKSLLPKWGMICKFMCKKLYFSIQGFAILFISTTISTSPYQTLEFFYLNSTLNPFSLVAIPFSSLVTSFNVNLNLFHGQPHSQKMLTLI